MVVGDVDIVIGPMFLDCQEESARGIILRGDYACDSTSAVL